MPYKNNDYKNFIRSARWQRLGHTTSSSTPYAYDAKPRAK